MTAALHGFPDWQTSLRTADLVSIGDTQTIIAGGGNVATIFDMRAYSSYSTNLLALCNAAATNWNPITITISWYPDQAASTTLYSETYQIFADSSGSVGFPAAYGRFFLQDAIHGPWFTVSVSNNGPMDITLVTNVLGNSRSIGRRYVQNPSTYIDSVTVADSGLLLSVAPVLAGGASLDTIIPMAPGSVGMRMQTIAKAGVFAFFTPRNVSIQGYNMALGLESHSVTQLPRTAVRANITNSAGAVGQFVWEIASGRDNW